jgi:hypothetical protein
MIKKWLAVPIVFRIAIYLLIGLSIGQLMGL